MTEQATAEDYAEHYQQQRLDVAGLAKDVAGQIPKRVRTYSPVYGTAGVSAALAQLSGWSWCHRYIVRHIIEVAGGLKIEGLTDADGNPLPACRDTANQIAKQLEVSAGTVDNALSKAVAEGVLARRSGSVRVVGKGRKFYPGKGRGPRVVYPGRVLCELVGRWGVSPDSETQVSPDSETPERVAPEISTEYVLKDGRVEGESESLCRSGSSARGDEFADERKAMA